MLTRAAIGSIAEISHFFPVFWQLYVYLIWMQQCEIKCSIQDLGGYGVQSFTNVYGQPLDQKKFKPLFKAMLGLSHLEASGPRWRKV